MRFKLTLLEMLVIVAIVGVLIGLLLPSGDYDHTHHYPDVGTIGVNLSSIAGEYHLSHGHGGDSLSILPDGRYSLISSACVGVTHRESGHVRDTDGHLILSPMKPGRPRMPRDFLPIRWDRRVYLIPPGEMEEFCDAIVRGDEPSTGIRGNYYLLQPPGRTDGLPALPAEWIDSLRKRITIGKIVSRNTHGTQVKVSLGSRQEVRVGSLLTLQGNSIGGTLQVFSVEDDSCDALVMDPRECKEVLEVGHNVVLARSQAD